MPSRTAKTCLFLAMLAFATPAAAQPPGSRGGGAQGAGPLQEVLAGLGEIADRLDTIDQRLTALEAADDPCTPDAIAAGTCTRTDLSTLTAQVCTTIEVGAALAAGYGIDGNTEVELGVGWEEVVDADVHWNVGMPFLLPVTPPVILPPPLPPIPPVLAPLPDVELTGEAGAGVELEVCFREIEVPGNDVEDFGLQLAAAIQDAAADIRLAARTAAQDHGLLQPGRVVTVMNGVRRVGAADVQIGSDGMVFFDRQSEMRQLADALPIGPGVQQFLDDPQALLPARGQLGDACEVAAATPALAPMAADTCEVLDSVPSLPVFTRAIEAVPDIRDRLFRIEARVDQLQQSIENAVPNPPPLPDPGFDPCSIPIVGRLCR